jgi:glycosyltransferase involved in cell wall biosynthesis
VLATRNVLPPDLDIVCLSHLRWDFVHQRPHHLMSRFAARQRVFFVEEPIPGDDVLGVTQRPCGVEVLVPQLRAGELSEDAERVQRRLLREHLRDRGVRRLLLWYYTPMALPYTATIDAAVVVYDCMDELTAFHGAPLALAERERELLRRADVVFTGGRSLYEAKRPYHRRVHAFSSSVDVSHFLSARTAPEDARRRGARDERTAPLRAGYMGVIDERFDTGLMRAAALARPDWQFTMLGPVVKIDPETLPRLANITYTGLQRYADLPAFLATWDVALIPFVRQPVTRYVSPTKLLEYLAAGLPVVSTSIHDVVHPYGDAGYVHIADDPESFVTAMHAAAAENRNTRLGRTETLLASTSWDDTWQRMAALIGERLSADEAHAVMGARHAYSP